MNPFQTERLIIREFRHDDLGEIYRILDVELKYRDAMGEVSSISQRKKWLDWTIKGYEQNKLLKNPPFGDNAIVLKENMQLIGACGYVPLLAPLGTIPYYRYVADVKDEEINYPEIGLFMAISPHYQCRGFAYEASRALIKLAFFKMKIRRILAVTSQHNNPSIAVMKRLEMQIEPLTREKLIVGFLENNNGETNGIS
jgi:RimJ/RimL family protein N-acetyltransferase